MSGAPEQLELPLRGGRTRYRHRIQLTAGECGTLADFLENLNKPGDYGSPLRELTDALWDMHAGEGPAVIYVGDAD